MMRDMLADNLCCHKLGIALPLNILAACLNIMICSPCHLQAPCLACTLSDLTHSFHLGLACFPLHQLTGPVTVASCSLFRRLVSMILVGTMQDPSHHCLSLPRRATSAPRPRPGHAPVPTPVAPWTGGSRGMGPPLRPQPRTPCGMMRTPRPPPPRASMMTTWWWTRWARGVVRPTGPGMEAAPSTARAGMGIDPSLAPPPKPVCPG